MSQHRMAIVSQEFEGGGAERVLSVLVNENLGRGYSLSHRISYVQDKSKVEFIKDNNIRVLRWITKAKFLHKVLRNNLVIITSDFTILLFLRLLNKLIYKKQTIIYRPSINAHYLYGQLKKLVGSWWSRKILLTLINDMIMIYQTNKIKESFENLGMRSSKYIVINNPFSGVVFEKTNKGERINRVAFIGRATKEKGYDRFFMLAHAKEMKEYFFDHFGANTNALSLKTDLIKERGWLCLSELNLQNTAVVIPSRIEGFPNIVLELIYNGIKPIVSIEVASYFEHLAEIHELLLIVDFEKNDFSIEVRKMLESGNLALNPEEVDCAKSSLMSSVQYVQRLYHFIYDTEKI